MPIFKALSVGLVALLLASSAGALVTVDHVAVGSTTLNVGDTIQVQVRLSWDGLGGLLGVFSSTAADDGNVLIAESAAFGANLYRRSIFAHTDPETGDLRYLDRFAPNQLRHSNDPSSAVRSIQYASIFSPLYPAGAAANVLVTTITFRAIGLGVTTIGRVLLPADIGPYGDTAGDGTKVTVFVVTPEPGTALLMGLGLAALGFMHRRNV